MRGREAAETVLKGAAMGTADLVPGVSGGTIALIVGIYDRLIDAIASLDPRALAHLRRVHQPEGRAAIAREWRSMDLTFLFALGTGMVGVVVVGSQLIPLAFEDVPGPTGAFFAGLIAASVVLIGRSVPWTPVRAAVAVLAAAVAVAVSVASVGRAEPSLLLVFVAGAVAISAMVLPGLSGSLLLLVLGLYHYMIEQLDGLLTALADAVAGGSPGGLVDYGAVVVTFLAGASIGVLTMARVVNYALERDRATTIAGLVGLMAGGLYPPGRMAVTNATTAPGGAVGVAIAALVGVALVAGFEYASGDLDYVDPDGGRDRDVGVEQAPADG